MINASSTFSHGPLVVDRVDLISIINASRSEERRTKNLSEVLLVSMIDASSTFSHGALVPADQQRRPSLDDQRIEHVQSLLDGSLLTMSAIASR